MSWLLNFWWKIRGVTPEDYYRNCARCGRKGRDHSGRLFACRRYKRAAMYSTEEP